MAAIEWPRLSIEIDMTPVVLETCISGWLKAWFVCEIRVAPNEERIISFSEAVALGWQINLGPESP